MGPPLILIVEDYPDTRDLYVEYLEFAGFHTISARDGMEAVVVALARRPDLIVMDLSLPKIDGCEATRRLRADERTRATPIIGLTGAVAPGTEETARQAGCTAFLTKPMLPEDLVEHVRKLLPVGAASGG